MAKRRTIRTISLYCRRMLRRLAPLLVATALLAGGCATETVPDSEKILIESSSSPLGPSKDDGKPKPKADKPKKPKPKPANVVTAAVVGLQFVAPKGWTTLTEADLANVSNEDLAAYAKVAGVSTDELQSSFSQGGLYLFGSSGSININAVGTGQVLPDEAEFRTQLGSRGFNISSVEDVSTPVGPGRVVYYSLSIPGKTAYGAALFLSVDGRIADLTVTTPDADRTRRLMLKVAPTLKRA